MASHANQEPRASPLIAAAPGMYPGPGPGFMSLLPRLRAHPELLPWDACEGAWAAPLRLPSWRLDREGVWQLLGSRDGTLAGVAEPSSN